MYTCRLSEEPGESCEKIGNRSTASSTDISFLTSPEEGGVRVILPVVLFKLKELAAAGHVRHVKRAIGLVFLPPYLVLWSTSEKTE